MSLLQYWIVIKWKQSIFFERFYFEQTNLKMATNSINLNNKTELSDDNEEMDVEQLGITEENDQHQPEG